MCATHPLAKWKIILPQSTMAVHCSVRVRVGALLNALDEWKIEFHSRFHRYRKLNSAHTHTSTHSTLLPLFSHCDIWNCSNGILHCVLASIFQYIAFFIVFIINWHKVFEQPQIATNTSYLTRTQRKKGHYGCCLTLINGILTVLHTCITLYHTQSIICYYSHHTPYIIYSAGVGGQMDGACVWACRWRQTKYVRNVLYLCNRYNKQSIEFIVLCTQRIQSKLLPLLKS